MSTFRQLCVRPALELAPEQSGTLARPLTLAELLVVSVICVSDDVMLEVFFVLVCLDEGSLGFLLCKRQ